MIYDQECWLIRIAKITRKGTPLSTFVQCGLACGHFDDAGDALWGRASSFLGCQIAGRALLPDLSELSVLSDLRLMRVELNLIPHLGIYRRHV